MLGVLVKSAQGVQLWGFLFMFFGLRQQHPHLDGLDARLAAGLRQVNPVTYLTDGARPAHRRAAATAVGDRCSGR
jgi:hypothetical protein